MSLSRHRTLKSVMLCIASLVLTVFVGLSYRQWERYRRANIEAERSRETLAAIDSILATLVDAETGERGFLLTGENSYLDPYNTAVQQLPTNLATLKNLLNGRQGGARDFDELNILANSRVDHLRQTIEVRRTKGAQAALAVVLTDEGKRTMDSIRVACARIQFTENANQARASGDGEAAAKIALLTTVAGSLALFFVFAFGFEPFASPDPLAWRRSWFLRHGAAILAVVAIALLRGALTPLIGPTSFPFTLFFCAVIFAAWFGGFRPASLAIALSLLAGDWFFAAPTRSLWISGRDDQIAALVLVLVGFGTALLSRSQRTAVDRAIRAEAEERNELEAMTRLHEIGNHLILSKNDVQHALHEVLDAAIVFTAADKGNIQLFDRESGALTIVAHRGFEEPFLRFFASVGEDNSACGTAMKRSERVIVEDITASEIFIGQGSLKVLLDAEIRAVQSTPLISSAGNVLGMISTHFRTPHLPRESELRRIDLLARQTADYLERRKAEDELAAQAAALDLSTADARSQHERLQGMIDSAMDAIITIDESQRIQVFNRAAEQVFRCPASDAVGQPMEKLLPERFRQAHQSHIELFGRSGVTTRSMLRPGILWGRRSDGEEFPLEASISQIEKDGKKIFTVILRDITERKRAEIELQMERERLSLALVTGRMGVYEVDLIRNVLWLSPESYSLLGTTSGDIAPSPEAFVEVVHLQDRELLLQHIKESIETHEPINHEFRLLRPDGRECWVSCQGQIEYNETGRAVSHSGLLADVTSRKQSEQMVRRFERLSAAAKLSAAVAHELNNPLAGAVNLIYLAKTAPGISDAAIELLVRAEQELERVAHAARQTLGFYRESNSPERIDVPVLIESILELSSTKLVSKHISIQRAFGECVPIQGVRGEVRQAVSNVIANAIDAVPKGGVIVIGVHSIVGDKQASAEIVIADNGPGIAVRDVDKIFEPFFTTKGGTGMGLGLWVARDIVERHGGTITVCSPDEGSELRGATVTIRFPCVPRPRRNESKVLASEASTEGEPAAH